MARWCPIKIKILRWSYTWQMNNCFNRRISVDNMSLHSHQIQANTKEAPLLRDAKSITNTQWCTAQSSPWNRTAAVMQWVMCVSIYSQPRTCRYFGVDACVFFSHVIPGGSAVVRNVTSQQEGPGFESKGVPFCVEFPCFPVLTLFGYSSFHSPKRCMGLG